MSHKEFGYNIGKVDIPGFDSVGYYETFGKRVSKKPQMILSDDDISTHVYITGKTGSGKTSIIKAIAKHLERSNSKALSGESDWTGGSFIYVDPKGDDAESVARQCDRTTISDGMLHYVDTAAPGFAINPLELPRYRLSERKDAVSFQINFMLGVIKKWCVGKAKDGDVLHMNKVVSDVLEYLYLDDDRPTLKHLYDLLTVFPFDTKPLKEIYGALRKPEMELKAAIKTVKEKPFEAIFVRLEYFVIGKRKRVFCKKESTVNVNEFISPGRFTVIKFNDGSFPFNENAIILDALMAKLWFEAANRPIPKGGGRRARVVLVIDEFQKAERMHVTETMIKQAHSKGVCLVFAHQSPEQISDDVFDSITQNFMVKMSGIMGNPAAAKKLGTVYEPDQPELVAKIIAGLPKYNFVGRVGLSSLMKFEVRFDPEAGDVCHSNMTEKEWKFFVDQKAGSKKQVTA